MPFPATTTGLRPEVVLTHWWLGPVNISAKPTGELQVITSLRKGSETEPSYHPADVKELRSVDLAAEFADDVEALMMIQSITVGLEELARKLLAKREGNETTP